MPSSIIARVRAAPVEVHYLFVFLVSLAIYNFVHRARLPVDSDTFYHVKMAQLIWQQGLVKEFIWLPYTTLAQNFADQHLLYHLLLIPFLHAYGAVTGVIVATEVFACLAVVAFYAALRAHGSRWPFLFTLMLATSYSFMVRVNLAKSGSLCVAVILLSLIAYRRQRPLVLFVLSWAYVLLHGGWPLMIGIAAAHVIAAQLVDRFLSPRPAPPPANRQRATRPRGVHANHDQPSRRRTAGFAWRDWLRQNEVRSGIAVLGGLACGLVINPYFPTNLRFYWEQVFQVAVVGYGDQIAVGVEWYPYPFGDFFVGNTALINAFLLCGALALVVWRGGRFVRRPSVPINRSDALAIVASLLLTVMFAVLTSRSRRHIEYLAPVGLFSAALLSTLLLAKLEVQALRERLRQVLPRAISRWLPLDQVIVVTLLALAVLYGSINVISATNYHSTGITFRSLERSATWLKENTPPNAIVVQSQFDQFGPLFYANDHNRYLCGLDPTFFFRGDPERYRVWRQLVTADASSAGKLASLVRDGLGSRYLLVGREEAALLRAAAEDDGLTMVYEDSEAQIFEVR